MTKLLLKNARIFDGQSSDCAEGMQVLVAEGVIQEISPRPIAAGDVQSIDVGGRTLMPGLIDAHVHAFASDVNIQRSDGLGEAYRTAHAVRMLTHALKCGFTTVRDVGGGSYGLRKALDDGLIIGPRLFYSGRLLSMTGGHGDLRAISEVPRYQATCGCAGPLLSGLGVIADGVDECIKCAREELRQGAHCIKIMASGGVASPTDPLWMNQYREDEIRAIVRECSERRSYVSAHCHPASAIRRCVEFGVRSIEHGTQIDAETARIVADKGAYVVPTMAIIFALLDLGGDSAVPKSTQEKIRELGQHALTSLDVMRSAGIKVGFGTDLLGQTYVRQCSEFALRGQVFSAVEILRQATAHNAELMMMSGQIGCIAPGALADMLVVEGDPLTDISLLGADGNNLRVIVRDGAVIKNELR
jgi:imidazolonepropionase-like amidohydrolase